MTEITKLFVNLTDKTTIPICDIISIKLQVNNADKRNKLQTLPTDQSKCFTVYYAKQCDKSNKWRPCSTTFHNNDTQKVTIWFKTIQDALNGKHFLQKRVALNINN